MEEIVEQSLKQGTKRKYTQSPPKKGKENQEPEIMVIKPIPDLLGLVYLLPPFLQSNLYKRP
jgi:hypothetical protein